MNMPNVSFKVNKFQREFDYIPVDHNNVVVWSIQELHTSLVSLRQGLNQKSQDYIDFNRRGGIVMFSVTN